MAIMHDDPPDSSPLPTSEPQQNAATSLKFFFCRVCKINHTNPTHNTTSRHKVRLNQVVSREKEKALEVKHSMKLLSRDDSLGTLEARNCWCRFCETEVLTFPHQFIK